MTMSQMRDELRPGGNFQRNFLESDAFEIKEEDDEYCYTPINQNYPE